MCSCHDFIWIWSRRLLRGRSRRRVAADCGRNRLNSLNRRRCIVVGLEHFQSSQFLVDESQRLELLCLCHLLFEPSLCFVLFDLLQIGVVIIDMSVPVRDAPPPTTVSPNAYLPVQLKKCQLLPLAMLYVSNYCTVHVLPSLHCISGRRGGSWQRLPLGQSHARQELPGT